MHRYRMWKITVITPAGHLRLAVGRAGVRPSSRAPPRSRIRVIVFLRISIAHPIPKGVIHSFFHSFMMTPPPIKNIVGDKDGQLNAKLRSLAMTNPELYELVVAVASEGQMHLFQDWIAPTKDVLPPSDINEFAHHIMEVDQACPDGLVGYIKNAKKLLKGKSITPLEN